MKISDNFRKLFPATAERFDLTNLEYMADIVEGIKALKEKYPGFETGVDMVGSIIRIEYDNGFSTSYEILRIKDIGPRSMKPTIIVDTFFRTDNQYVYSFSPNQTVGIDTIIGKENISKFSKSKFDKMFISCIGLDYLKSLNL